MYLSERQQHLFAGITLLILWSFAPPAQAAKTLTLEESMEIAKQTNLTSQTVRERVKSAESQVRAARAGLLPNVSISSSYTYTPNLAKSVLQAGGGFGPPGIGNNMQFQDVEDSVDSSDVIELEFGAHRNFRGEAALRQPIFAWGRYYYNYQSAKINLEGVRKELEATHNQLALDVSEAFYGILLAVEFEKVSQQTVDLVEKQLQFAQNLFDSGAATKFDVLRAEVQLANTKSQLIRTQNRARTARNAYKNILNIDLAEDVNIKGNFDAPDVELNLESLIQTAKTQRPEVHQLGFNEQANQKRVAVAKAGNRPDLAFFVNYQVDDNERLREMNRIWNLGFALNFPIFDGFATRAAVQQSETALRQAQLGKHQLIDAIEFEVRSAYLNLVEAKALIEVQRNTVEQARESLRIANLRYENGIITSVEFTDAQLALTQAEVNRLQSLHDYVVGLKKLEKVIGRKLDG